MRALAMLDMVLAGGLVVALAGVIQAASTVRQRRRASPATLLRQALERLEPAEAEVLRAELRGSGLALRDHRAPRGLF